MKDSVRSALFFASIVLLGAGALAVHGATGQTPSISTSTLSAYGPDAQITAFRVAVVASDSVNVATLTSSSTGEFKLGNAGGCRSTISVSARFSVAGQSCIVKILYLYRSPSNETSTGAPTSVLGSSTPITLTAQTLVDLTTGYFEAPTAYFDGSGATNFRLVVITPPTSGSVDFFVGSF